jgi:tetraacyldisaccharide 4'-kinase
VGNITWGGTGKTPLVENLAKFFKQQGRNPAVLIRGYGKDEVYMLKNKLKGIPVLSGRNRIRNARIALRRLASDIIILDDGFQHWRLRRDLDIVLVDARRPFGNRHLIPRGILREPLSSLKRADIFVLTKAEQARDLETLKQELRKYNSRAPIYEAGYSASFLRNLESNQRIEVSTIRGKPVAVVCGIADPGSLTGTLDLLGARVILKFNFRDHYRFRQKDLTRIEQQCLEHQVQTVITTEKDLPRLTPLLKSKRSALKFLALAIELRMIKNEEGFFQFLKNGKPAGEPFSILILSDGKAGHLNQAKAVAGIVKKRKIEQGADKDKIAVKVKEVKFRNRFTSTLLGICSIFSHRFCRDCLSCMRLCLKKSSFEELIDSAADLIISCGSSVSSLNLLLSYKNKAHNIILMKPGFLNLDKFDLVIVPEHDRIRVKDNILLTGIAPNLIDRQYLKQQAEILNREYGISSLAKASSFAKASEDRSQDRRTTEYGNKGPTIGVLIGGDTPKYRLTMEIMQKVISQLKEVVQRLDGRVLITTSRRTPKAVEKALQENFANLPNCRLLVIANQKNIPEAVGGILGLSDIVLVSGESISMVSEAVSAQKYVLVFMPRKMAALQMKQEGFLRSLEKKKLLKVIQAQDLAGELQDIYQTRPERVKIKDNEHIYQALSRIV